MGDNILVYEKQLVIPRQLGRVAVGVIGRRQADGAASAIDTAPLRQFHGMADDWVTVAPCHPYFERLRAAGRDAKLTEYPDAHHSYDNPLGSKTPVIAKDAQSTRDCFLKEESRGIIINVKSGQPFSYKDPCVVLNPHTGHNEAATLATRNEVTALLKTVFKL